MTENKVKSNNGFTTKIKKIQEKYLPYTEKTIRRLSISAAIMLLWIMIWALVFKLCDENILGMTYRNLKELTPMERIMWDLIPFNYRGTDYWKMRQMIDTALNCFVFAPYGALFCYIFKKRNVFRDAGICLGICISIELLQLATMLGNPATEDLITNTLGCFIGHGINVLAFDRMSLKAKTMIVGVVNLILIGGSIYAIITTIGAADVIYGIITRTL